MSARDWLGNLLSWLRRAVAAPSPQPSTPPTFDWGSVEDDEILPQPRRRLRLHRMRENDFATYGRIEDEENRQLCVTIELPWVDADRDGKRDRSRSRFAPGTYRCERAWSPSRKRDVFWIRDVPDISDAQLHIACLPRDLRGCIGVGTQFGPVRYPDMAKSEPGITDSTQAFNRFMNEQLADVEEFDLEVIDDFPTPSPQE